MSLRPIVENAPTSSGAPNERGTPNRKSHDFRYEVSTKARCASQLVQLLSFLSSRSGGRPIVYLLNDQRPARQFGPEEISRLDGLQCDGVATLPELLVQGAIPLRTQSARIVVSDFLFPDDPAAIVRRLSAGAGSLWLLQVLSGWEANPTELGGRRLVDLESTQHADLRINRQRIAEYQARLKQLQTDWTTAARSVHATFVTLVAEEGLPMICRDVLRREGILIDA